MMRSVLKPIIRKAEALVGRMGYRWSWVPRPVIASPGIELEFGLEFVIAHLMLDVPSPFVVQIGANDGVSNDPLHRFIDRFKLEGILVEPLPEIFERLQETYRSHPQLTLVNAALSEEDGSRTIYTIRMDDQTFSRAHQFTSFRLEQVLTQTQWVPDVASRIEERQVKAISFATLLEMTGGRNIDILQIDTEGYDFAILRMIDFTRTRPSIICYEHVHMSKDEEELATELLAGRGYRLSRDSLDTVAYRPHRTYGFR